MKRKFVCGIVFCLALSMAGCGKNSEEQQAANYYQNELGLDKDEAEELANAFYGEDDTEEDEPEEETTVVEPLPELLESEWYEGKFQLYDMVFSNDMSMTTDDIRQIAEASEYDVEVNEGFDIEGNVIVKSLVVNGENYNFDYKLFSKDSYEIFVENGLEDGGYYRFDYNYLWNIGFDKVIMDFEELGTRDNVLAYLEENGFALVEPDKATYSGGTPRYLFRDTLSRDLEHVDTPHYTVNGVQSVDVWMVMVGSEIDKEITYKGHTYSGGHVNVFEEVIVRFNTDGTISSVNRSELNKCLILGEEVG